MKETIKSGLTALFQMALDDAREEGMSQGQVIDTYLDAMVEVAEEIKAAYMARREKGTFN